ncbi:hypothetical protein VP01_2397g6 [Puccinia sorghi]|uniref:SNF2 N-terminal domain-containing protein n=1 Tax=Puccinia sorghi TaxID=27349 RepID=A0A0L6V7I0_9BASI|nr:hypothetical protein VP01_2397g6 [Puccinia sorghi]
MSASVLRKFLVGPIGTVSTEVDKFLARKAGDQIPSEMSIPRVIMNATLIASPTPTPTLMVMLTLFTAPGHSAELINLFGANSLHVKIFKGYCPEECWGIPHSLHFNVGKQLFPEKPIHGFKTTLLGHQKEALDFILELESPKSSTLSRFWNSSTSEWLKHVFDHLLNTGMKKGSVNNQNQGSILAYNMGLGKTLKSLVLIVASKNVAEVLAGTRSQNAKATLVICPLSTFSNWEADIHKHLDLNLANYAVYHGEERQNWLTQMLCTNDIVLVTYDTVASLYDMLCKNQNGFASY